MQRKSIRRQIKKSCACLDTLKILRNFWQLLDIFMLTSDRNEGVPQSLMQALAMEIPSIAGNIGSIADLHFYSQGKPNFILTQNPNLEEFIEALELLIRKERRILPSRDFICKNFSLVAMGEKTMQVYQNLLS
ncbi:glycosyltransferase [Helicobacter ganmani]|uniref:glycosyltransferase n=1 Tax=Helicobacter ganmani TaxID=60246 RepID=UPI003A8A9337